ncbi:ABC transporter ATP-binding protein, partial [candidate division KSB1 bacterium]
AQGNVWSIQIPEAELSLIKEKYPVVSSIPTEAGFEVHLVGNKIENYDATPVEPNIEHAYVHFLENKLGETWIEEI